MLSTTARERALRLFSVLPTDQNRSVYRVHIRVASSLPDRLDQWVPLGDPMILTFARAIHGVYVERLAVEFDAAEREALERVAATTPPRRRRPARGDGR